MNLYFMSAAVLTFLTAISHSLLGERHFLKRLLVREFPDELGIDEHINRTTRTAWHLTTLAWVGFAVILALLSYYPPSPAGSAIAHTIGIFFTISGATSLLGSRGRHLLGIVFLFNAGMIWIGM